MKRFIVTLICRLVFGILSLMSAADAHDSRPLYVEIAEIGSRVRVEWAAPPSVVSGNGPQISFSGCVLDSPMGGQGRSNGAQFFKCDGGLNGRKLEIRYRQYNPSLSTLVRVRFEGGQTSSAVLSPDVNQWGIPPREEFSSVARSYFEIGIDHILRGYDHILFLIGLIVIAGSPRRILITATGFTAAHSLTIFLVALNLLRVSVPAVETVIALSIVFLAAEIARPRRDTLTWRRPILVAGGFGLVHGAGFASALAEIGLPQTEKITALLFFNIGVEAGQICLIAVVLGLIWGLRKIFKGRLSLNSLQAGLTYAMGGIAAYWFLERLYSAVL